MNKNKFRGKDIETKEWVYGSLIFHYDIKINKHSEILTYGNGKELLIEVDPFTVGECIGKNDVNGREIYTSDIIEYFDWCYASKYTKEVTNLPYYNHNYDCLKRGVLIGGYYKPLIGLVKWNEEALTYEPLISSQEDFNNNCFAYVCDGSNKSDANPRSYYKVIGNKFDNPELLEVK